MFYKIVFIYVFYLKNVFDPFPGINMYKYACYNEYTCTTTITTLTTTTTTTTTTTNPHYRYHTLPPPPLMFTGILRERNEQG